MRTSERGWRRRCVVAGMGVAAAANFAAYGVLVLEDFDYGAGELTGANGGSGFSAAWSSVSTANTQIVPAGLSYTDGVTGLTLSSAGRALQVGNTDGNNINRALRTSSTINQSSLFVSLLVSFSSGTISASDSAYLYFGIGSASATSERMGVFAAGNANGDLGIQLSNGSTLSTKYDGGTFGSGTYLLVAKLEKVGQTGASDPYDKMSFWVNPSLYASTFMTPDQVIDNSGANLGVSSLNRLGFGTSLLETGDNVLFDRIRMGDAVSDILPLAPEGLPVIPESQTVGACAGLVALGGAWYARRRRTPAS